MKMVKNYLQYEADGFTTEFKYNQETNGTIKFTTGIEVNLVPFAMDVKHSRFIVFMVPRKSVPNLYVWVFLMGDYRDVHISTVEKLMFFHSEGPVDVSGNYPDEIINKAINAIQKWLVEDTLNVMRNIKEIIIDSNNKKELKKDDASILRLVKEAKKENKGILFLE